MRGVKIFSFFTLGRSNPSSERGVQNFCHVNLNLTTPYCWVINDQPLTQRFPLNQRKIYVSKEIKEKKILKRSYNNVNVILSWALLQKIAIAIANCYCYFTGEGGFLFCRSRKLTYFHCGKRKYSVSRKDFRHKNSDGNGNTIFLRVGKRTLSIW